MAVKNKDMLKFSNNLDIQTKNNIISYYSWYSGRKLYVFDNIQCREKGTQYGKSEFS